LEPISVCIPVKTAFSRGRTFHIPKIGLISYDAGSKKPNFVIPFSNTYIEGCIHGIPLDYLGKSEEKWHDFTQLIPRSSRRGNRCLSFYNSIFTKEILSHFHPFPPFPPIIGNRLQKIDFISHGLDW